MFLVTALPRTGKTTAIKKLITMLGRENCGGFFTEEIRENDERVGFQIKTLDGKCKELANVNSDSNYRIGRYGVNLENFEELCLPVLERAIVDEKIKYIIIDEIGPMQMFSYKYKKLLLKLLHVNKIVLGTIFYSSYPWIDEFKQEQGVQLIEVTLENRNNFPFELLKIVTANNQEMQGKVLKSEKYIDEPDRIIFDGDKYIFNSMHGVRIIQKKQDGYVCTCEFFNKNKTCSHILTIIKRESNNEYQQTKGSI